MWKPLVLAFLVAFATPVLAQTESEAQRADAVMAQFPQFTGAVLVVRDGKTEFRKAYGQANRELSVPNTPAMKFRIGSITKQFTAMAILQLAEAGKLSVDDPVSKYVANAPAAWSGVTVKHLLTHTSGIPTYTGQAAFLVASRQTLTPDQVVAIVRDMPLISPAGSRYAYNNTGYVLLGMIVEKASGQGYAQYLQANIFGPLGMKDSGYDSSSAILTNRASGYRGELNASFVDMSTPYAAGALYSTVDDMLLWDQALAAGKLISPVTYAEMWKDQGFGYGYGWLVGKQFGKRRIGHGGDINGFSSLITRYPDDRLTVILLSNAEGAPRDPITGQLAALYLRLPPRTAAPGGAEALRQSIENIKRGTPDYSKMAPGLASATQRAIPQLQAIYASIGDLKAVTLIAADPDGRDRYRVEGTTGEIEYAIETGPDGIRQSASYRVIRRAAVAGGVEVVRRLVGEFQRGEPDYTKMAAPLAAATRSQVSGLQAQLSGLGEVKAVTLIAAEPNGLDRYRVEGASGAVEMSIALTLDGVVQTALMRPIAR